MKFSIQSTGSKHMKTNKRCSLRNFTYTVQGTKQGGRGGGADGDAKPAPGVAAAVGEAAGAPTTT